jgi:6-pyruvoyltetrahydropterin/6-carboxytetrahydropterin synthase
MTEQYHLEVEEYFSAAHFLRGYRGNCEKLHGHNWRVKVIISAPRLNKLGMVIDFREAKRKLGEVLKEVDHVSLNELPYFKKRNPTTEAVAKFIFEKLAPLLKENKLSLSEVIVWEGEGCGVRYTKR